MFDWEISIEEVADKLYGAMYECDACGSLTTTLREVEDGMLLVCEQCARKYEYQGEKRSQKNSA